MTRSAIITGLALALSVGAVPALSQEGEKESRDAITETTRLAQESAAEHVSGRAEPVPETPEMLPALWEQIKANADTVPMRGRAEPVPETPDLLPALWEQIRANADTVPMRGRAESVPETPDLLPALWEQIKANADPGPVESGRAGGKDSH